MAARHNPCMYARDQAIIATPIGVVRVIATTTHLVSLSIEQGHALIAPVSPLLNAAQTQLDEWFSGTRRDFDLPLLPLESERGNVLRQGMIAISFGATTSYGALARMLNSSPRAIGQACARNPLPIIVPCHRVLAAGGVLGAYSGGDGPVTKAWLLAHEQRYAPAPLGQLDFG